MDELVKKLEQLKKEKDEKIIPENIKKGITIFGVNGNLESNNSLDTSDATASINDIIEGKTAYVNGEKISGNFKLYGNIGTATNTDPNSEIVNYPDPGMIRIITHTNDRAGYLQNSLIETDVFYDKLIEAIGLTPDKLKTGETILGITGN